MTEHDERRRERRRELLIWSVAVAAAISTGFGARAYLHERSLQARAEAEARFHPKPMVVARMDLVPGSLLRPESLAIRNMPADFLPASAVPAAEAAQLLGRTLEHAVRAGEPLQMPLLKTRAPERLAQRIALGRRAVTIGVDEAAAAAGLLSPGDRVDLRWRGGSGDRLENIAVLATGRQFGPGTPDSPAADFATVTLELTAADARKLAEADLGDLRLVLRNPSDTGSELPGARHTGAGSPGAVPVLLITGGGGGPSPSVRLLRTVTP
jgi:pilus assembly protein CpaB